eukprot:1996082-Amphidinium_carterae.1
MPRFAGTGIACLLIHLNFVLTLEVVPSQCRVHVTMEVVVCVRRAGNISKVLPDLHVNTIAVVCQVNLVQFGLVVASTLDNLSRHRELFGKAQYLGSKRA